MQLVQRLIRRGVLAASDLARVSEAHFAAPNKPLHELLIERGFAKEEDVLPALAEEFGMELVDLTQVTVEPETLKAMPLKLVHRRSLMPLSRSNGTLVVATGDPYDVYALDELQMLTGLQIHPVLASPRDEPRYPANPNDSLTDEKLRQSAGRLKHRRGSLFLNPDFRPKASPSFQLRRLQT